MADARSRAEKEQGEPGISCQKDRRVSLKEAPTGSILDNMSIQCTLWIIEYNTLNNNMNDGRKAFLYKRMPTNICGWKDRKTIMIL